MILIYNKMNEIFNTYNWLNWWNFIENMLKIVNSKNLQKQGFKEFDIDFQVFINK